MSKKTQTDIQRINQALSAAISSINLAKNLLKDIDNLSQNKIDTREIEGIIGVFDGKNLVTSDGKTVEVPVNYASKSKIVFGDTLKMIEDNDRNIFKQIERVKRLTKVGILSKKGSDMFVVTGDGTYAILQVAVEFYGLQEGGQVQVLVPEENIHAPFAAIDKNLDDHETKTPKKESKDQVQPDKKKPEVKQEEKVKVKKIQAQKKPEVAKKDVKKDTKDKVKHTNKNVSSPAKQSLKSSTSSHSSKKSEINAISDSKSKPKTTNLVGDDNSISRIIGDDDLR